LGAAGADAGVGFCDASCLKVVLIQMLGKIETRVTVRPVDVRFLDLEGRALLMSLQNRIVVGVGLFKLEANVLLAASSALWGSMLVVED